MYNFNIKIIDRRHNGGMPIVSYTINSEFIFGNPSVQKSGGETFTCLLDAMDHMRTVTHQAKADPKTDCIDPVCFSVIIN